MSNVLEIHGPSGLISFVDYRDFVDRITMKLTPHENVVYQVAQQTEMQDLGFAQPNATLNIQQAVVSLKPRYEEIPQKFIDSIAPHGLNNPSLGDSHMQFKRFVETHLFPEARRQFMAKRLIHLIMQKRIDGNCRDLTLEKMEDYSIEWAENMGSDGFAITFELSKYQKFLAIADPSCFIAFSSDMQMLNRPKNTTPREEYAIAFLGELVTVNPDRWLLYQYENDTIRTEVKFSERYRG